MFFVRRHFFTVVGQSWHRIKSFRQFNHVSAILRSTYTVSILTPRQKFADNKTGPISTDGQICFIFLIPEEKNWLHVLSWRSVIHEWQLWELAPEYAPCTANNFLGGGGDFCWKKQTSSLSYRTFYVLYLFVSCVVHQGLLDSYAIFSASGIFFHSRSMEPCVP